ncbi:hypothetical protein [Paenibacillus gallinarum]|uniref:Uncharacterized protein n=1 Tax=Paenibacillus gallinarum TaxID=2762232 RepID=A0ABR8T3R3_9BACL|nr:hypothetical protein [Paenibacillus gallinarum]MBD7970397.1 hypothetical protein [Paenibacillus gallinarum]
MTTAQAIQTQTIQERITDLINIYTQDRNEVIKLQEKLKTAETNFRESGRNVVFMQRMAQIARYDQNTTEWQERYNDDYSSSHENEWVQFYELKVATYEFVISISRKRNLKKFKHVVHVRGSKMSISEIINAVDSSYRDYTYVEDKYRDEEINKKFVNIEDAIAFVEEWKSRLESDHAESLQEQRDINRQLKDAGLIYDRDTARENSFKRGYYEEPLTSLDEIGIVDKKTIS